MNIVERIDALIGDTLMESDYDLDWITRRGNYDTEILDKRKLKKFQGLLQDFFDGFWSLAHREGLPQMDRGMRKIGRKVERIMSDVFEQEIDQLRDEWDESLAEQMELLRYQALDSLYEMVKEETYDAFERARENEEGYLEDEYWNAHQASTAIKRLRDQSFGRAMV